VTAPNGQNGAAIEKIVTLTVNPVEYNTSCGVSFTITGTLEANHATEGKVCASLTNTNACRISDANSNDSKCSDWFDLPENVAVPFAVKATIACQPAGDTYFEQVMVQGQTRSGCNHVSGIAVTIDC